MYQSYGQLSNGKNSYAIHSVSYHVQTTHPFGQNYTLSWILVSIPAIFSMNWAHWPFSDQMSVLGYRLTLVPLFA